MSAPIAPRIDVDAASLPSFAFGHRSPIWWGLLLLVAIEATAMGLLLVSAIYLRGDADVWPPSSVGPSALRLALLQAGLLGASALPMAWSVGAARRQRLRSTRGWLAVATVLGAAMLVVRIWEIPRIAFRWDSHAFGSVFWMVLGVHITHVLTGVLENAMLLALLFIGPVENKHYADIEASALLWYFAVLEWAPALAILYGAPILGRP
jgi:cytochrome c oxidase subunit 3